VPDHDGEAEQAEEPAGEAGPQPDAVPVIAEPAVEGQQHDERHEPEQRAGDHDAPSVDPRGWRHDEVWHGMDSMSVAQPLTVDLGFGPPADVLVRRAAGWPALVCLTGEWADSAALLTSHPVQVASAHTALARQPSVPDAAAGFVGGGWFGRLAFDGASRLGFHDHVVRLIGGRWRFEALWQPSREQQLNERLDAWRALLGGADDGPSQWEVGEFAGRPWLDHLSAVERAIELIRAGELYQVNVCTRLSAAFSGDDAAFFADLVTRLQPRFGAYLSGDVAIASMSPELFVERRGRDVHSAPIKGTLPRRPGDGNDVALRRSAKDTAENVMIVDLVRNDLGRVCTIGTVRPAALLDVEAHPGVWHLVSRVCGRLRPGVTDADLIEATFPPGSVTGAPKIRALAAIAELEPDPRGAYTGAIGFASPAWGAQFSVAIRTFEITADRVELGVGGGITADSVPMLEWRECLHKAAPLLSAAGSRAAARLPAPDADPLLVRGGLLETILGVDGVPVRVADHLARLDRSCRELFGAGVPQDAGERVAAAAKTVPVGRAVLRVTVSPRLRVTVTAAPAARPPSALDATTRVRAPGLWRHKWADRSWADGAGTAIFAGTDGAVLETVRGNVFLIEDDGTLVTPPLRDDLLPGVTRRALLDLARDEGRRTEVRAFDTAELTGKPAFWTSSLSGAVPITSVDGVHLPRADALVAALSKRLLAGNQRIC
jgi:para-aminobenzoate synthetase/4-amino-4-deoxychorismate lyase